MSHTPNYYEILQVNPDASVTEIVSAYHAAKSAYSGDSVATYTLMSNEEVEAELKKIEEAYQILSHGDKRAQYNRLLGGSLVEKPSMTQLTPSSPPETPVDNLAAPAPTAQTEVDGLPSPFNGRALQQLRTQRNLSLEDVARITKIPLRFIKAIEEENPGMPTRVYLQGFVKNLGTLYKVSGANASKRFLEHLDSKKSV